jgi:flagellin-like hook-associated protein FlgL
MSTDNISLNASVRNVLLSLQRTDSDMSVVQGRLASGKRVASAIDDPVNYFRAKNLYDTADDLFSLKDGITNAMNTVKTATDGLTAIEGVLKQMKGLAEQAKASSVAADRTAFKTQYDALRTQLDKIASDSTYDGVNLIKGTPDSLTVTFNRDGSASMSVTGTASDATGLAVTAAGDWGNATLATGTAAIDADIALLSTAMSTVRSTAATLGSSNSLLKIRSDFTKNMITTHRAGADDLTNADMNDESAKLLALQTRSQLALNSLSMANQSAQGVLRLFG